MKNSYSMHKSKLNEEYINAFEKIEAYVNATGIDTLSQEELLSSLIDSFLSAQNEKKPVEKITGKNIDRFCREICSGFGFKEHFIALFEYIKPAVYILFIFSLLNTIPFFGYLQKNPELNYFQYHEGVGSLIDFVGGLLLGFLLNFLISIVLKHIFFKKKKLSIRWAVGARLFAILIVLVLFVGGMLLLDNISPDSVLSFDIPLWTIQIFSLMLTVICTVISRRLKNNMV